MEYLLNVTAKYRVHTVEDAQNLHQRLKDDHRFELVSFSRTTKYIKVKGEIVEEYQVVKAKKVFNNEKEPDRNVDVKYGTNLYGEDF